MDYLKHLGLSQILNKRRVKAQSRSLLLPDIAARESTLPIWHKCLGSN